MGVKKTIASVVGVVAVVGLGFVGYKTWHNSHQTYTFQAPASTGMTGKTAIERGQYLAQAGDCVACHTAPGGKPFAGGLGLATPFGTIYATNITPDKDTGIGGWTDQQFMDAVRNGKGIHGENLYPAMPYNVYAKVSDQDLKDLKAYLDSVPAVHYDGPKTNLPFPYNIRLMMFGWNLLFLDTAPFKADPKQSDEWNRGAYLVEGLGHCTSCHTPKNLLGADDFGVHLQGNQLEGWLAPEITGNKRQGVGAWSNEELVDYLKTGANDKTVAANSMAEAVHNSLQHMNKQDLTAMAVYLKSLPGSKDETQTLVNSQDVMARGKDIYLSNCAACHQSNGEGVRSMVPALKGNNALQASEPTNVLHVLMVGAQGAATDSNPTSAAMPEFGWKLTDQQMADVSTYVRNSWGNSAPEVTADQAAAARKLLSGDAALHNPATK
ncbi:cytochrome c [Rouxiella badensis]|nr:cytochrome c [Rouxiella badensis]